MKPPKDSNYDRFIWKPGDIEIISVRKKTERTKPPMTKKKKNVLKTILEALTDPDIFSGIKRKTVSEKILKLRMHVPLNNKLIELYKEEKKCSDKTARRYVEKNLRYEGGIHNISIIKFLGTGHHPDFDYVYDKKKIAIEIKKCDTGSQVRQSLGQSIVYRSNYDYCVCVVVDSTNSLDILDAFKTNENDQKLIKQFFEKHNILFAVV